MFEIGQSVYFKREDSSRWKGPGDVIGIQGETIVIKYGGNIVRVHSCRVQLENTEFLPEKKNSEIDNSAPIKEKDELNVINKSYDTDQLEVQRTVTQKISQMLTYKNMKKNQTQYLVMRIGELMFLTIRQQ